MGLVVNPVAAVISLAANFNRYYLRQENQFWGLRSALKLSPVWARRSCWRNIREGVEGERAKEALPPTTGAAVLKVLGQIDFSSIYPLALRAGQVLDWGPPETRINLGPAGCTGSSGFRTSWFGKICSKHF